MIKFVSNGTNTNDADAIADDIVYPRTAYVAGSKITGNIRLSYKTEPADNYTLKQLTDKFTCSDILDCEDIKILVGVLSNTLYVKVYDINFNILSEKSIAMTGNFDTTAPADIAIGLDNRDSSIISCTIMTTVFTDSHKYQAKKLQYNISDKTITLLAATCKASIGIAALYPRTPADLIHLASHNNVFVSNALNRTGGEDRERVSVLTVNWDTNTIGTFMSGNIGICDTRKTILETGDGEYISSKNSLVKLDILNNRVTTIASGEICLSHDLAYMVTGNTLYKLGEGSTLAEKIASKQEVKALGTTSLGLPSFSKDDRFIIVPEAANLKIFTFNKEAESVELTQNVSLNLKECKYSGNSYMFLISNTSSLVNLAYCLESATEVDSIVYKSKKYVVTE